uniref:Uncharacterized protein n=1 Tax=Oryza brachyantha TaxID=4533 RepID=J3KYL6_ORYBR
MCHPWPPHEAAAMSCRGVPAERKRRANSRQNSSQNSTRTPLWSHYGLYLRATVFGSRNKSFDSSFYLNFFINIFMIKHE